MGLNDRYTKHLVVSDSATVNPSQMAENVILVNSAGQKVSTKTDAELNSRFAPIGSGADSDLLLPDGEFSPPRFLMAGTHTLTSGELTIMEFTAKRTEAITHLSMYSRGVAAGATPTLVRFGVFTINADQSVTPLAVIANDTALFAATYTPYKRALDVTWNKVAGQRYGLGVMCVTGATAPQVYSGTNWGYAATVVHQVMALNPAVVRKTNALSAWPTTTFTPASEGQALPCFRMHTS